jgi:hypothetical protein
VTQNIHERTLDIREKTVRTGFKTVLLTFKALPLGGLNIVFGSLVLDTDFMVISGIICCSDQRKKHGIKLVNLL